MKYSIIYATSYGQTRTIADHIAQTLTSRHGVYAELVEVSERRPDPAFNSQTDFLIIGSPVFRERFPRVLTNWLKQHRGQIQQKPVAVFTVSLNAADQRPEARVADDELLMNLINEVGTTPKYVASFAGALKYLEYNWVTRFIMKHISRAAGGPTDTSKNYEMTNWDDVKTFANTLLQQSENPKYFHEKTLVR